MNSDELLNRIRATGYWRVNLRPSVYEPVRFPRLADCWDAVESAKVSLRGWDYPDIDDSIHGNMANWIESGSDFGEHVEYWRLYQSGQFVHYFAMFEDYREVPWTSTAYPGRGKPDKYLEILNTLLRMTEIFEFAARLAQRNVLSPDVVLNLSLHGTSGRQLVYWDLSRFVRRAYTCTIPEIQFERTHRQAELMAGVEELSRSAAVHFFERFNWVQPPAELFAADQRRLLTRTG